MKLRLLFASIVLAIGLAWGAAAQAANVLLVVANNGSLTTEESAIRTQFQSWGHTVSTIWDNDSQANFDTAVAAAHVAYIPSTIQEWELTSKLRAASIGVVCAERYEDVYMGFSTGLGWDYSATQMNLTNNSHEITTGFATGLLTICSSSATCALMNPTLASGFQTLADQNYGNKGLGVIEKGGALAQTTNGNSTASGRRVRLCWGGDSFSISSLNSNGLTILRRSLVWAANRSLVAHWKLDETSGTSAADSSGNGNTGTVTGTTTWTSAVLNNGFQFNGSTKIQATGMFSNPKNLSVAAWANLTAADTSGSEIISLGDHFYIRLDEGGVTKAAMYTGSAWQTVSVSTTFAGIGWHHFAAVFDDDSNTFKLYVDGVVAASATNNNSISYAGLGANTVIGRNGNSSTSNDFTGVIDDVRVYNYALTATEVAQLHGLIGQWKLNQTSGASVTDSTAFARNGTISGTASWATDCGGMRAFDFNGSTNYVSVTSASDFQPTGMLSFSAWVYGDTWKAGADGDVNTIFRKGDAAPNNHAFAISGGKVALYLDDSDTAGFKGNTVLNTGQWYFVAATWDGTTAKIYVNGVLDNSPGTAKAAPIGTDTRTLYIGGRSGTDGFDGLIRDARFYNRPLTSTELAAGAGLMGHWKFAEGAGSAAADSSLAGNNATLSGGATWTSDCAGNNNALLTNGAGAIAQTTAPFDPPDVGTVAFWMRSTGTPASVARILGATADWEIRQNPDGRVISDLSGDGATTIGTVTPLTEVGRWYHFAATFDASDKSYAIYVDGQQQLSGINPATYSKQPPAILSFGTRTGSTEYWNGALRDVRVYNRKLCPAEIEELYGLVGHWKLNETSGTSAADSSGMGRTGSVVGTPTWTAGKIDNAIQFNGTNRVEVNSLMGSPKNITLAGWANATSTDSGGAELISIGNYFAVRLGSTTAICFFYNGSTWSNVGVSQTLVGNGWHHLAAVFSDDANYCKLYIDGIEKASLNTTVTIPFSGQGTKTVIGAHGSNGNAYDFIGKVDDVRVYNRALCPSEVLELKNAGGGFGGVKLIKWVEIQ